MMITMSQTINELFQLNTTYTFRGITFQDADLIVREDHYYVWRSDRKVMEGYIDVSLSEAMTQLCYQPICVTRLTDQMKSGYTISAANGYGDLRCIDIHAQDGFRFFILRGIKNSSSIQYLHKNSKNEWFEHTTNTFIELMKQSNTYRLPLITGSLTFEVV